MPNRRPKTLQLLAIAREVLEVDRPMTVRQIYYQLVARHAVENKPSRYLAVSRALANARKDGVIPWEWIEDRLRRPRGHRGWSNVREFIDYYLDFGGYVRQPWQDEDHLVELWLEKDALSAIVDEYASKYYLTLNVGRGYDGWSSIHDAAERYEGYDEVTILYFGDFDPSGEDMFSSLDKRLAELGCFHPNILKIGLTREHIETYNLPPDVTKPSDSRSKAFVEKHGDISAELDALPPAVFRELVESSILEHINVPAFEESKRIQTLERAALARIEASLKKSADRLMKKELAGL